MKWSYGNRHCLNITPSQADLLSDILTSTYEALRTGLVTMDRPELVDFNELCSEADLHLKPLTPESIPILRRIK